MKDYPDYKYRPRRRKHRRSKKTQDSESTDRSSKFGNLQDFGLSHSATSLFKPQGTFADSSFKYKRLQRSGSADEAQIKRFEKDMQYQRVTASAPLLTQVPVPTNLELQSTTISNPYSIPSAQNRLGNRTTTQYQPPYAASSYTKQSGGKREMLDQTYDPAAYNSCMWNSASIEVDRIKRGLMDGANRYAASYRRDGIYDQIKRDELQSINRDEFDQYINGAVKSEPIEHNQRYNIAESESDHSGDADIDSASSEASADMTDQYDSNNALAQSVSRVDITDQRVYKTEPCSPGADGNGSFGGCFNESPLISAVMNFKT